MVAASYMAATSVAAAELKASRKLSKYSPLQQQYHFLPAVFETLDPINNAGLTIITELGSSLTHVLGDVRETSHHFQYLSAVIQQFNAVAFCNTFSMLELYKVWRTQIFYFSRAFLSLKSALNFLITDKHLQWYSILWPLEHDNKSI